MRYLFRILIFSVGIITLNAEEPMPSGEFANLTLEDAAKAVVAAELNPTLLADYAAAAVQSRRPELVSFCFENPRIAHTFDYAVSKLPDSPYKEELMLMMLRSGSPFWGSLSDIARFPGHLDIDKTSAPFRALIEKYLPNMSLDDSLTSTREARSKLADRIEAIKHPKPKAEGPQPDVNREPPTPSASVPTATPVPSKPTPNVAENPAPVVEHGLPLWPWLVGGMLALVLVGALVLKLRA